MKGNVTAGYIPRCEALAVAEAQKKRFSYQISDSFFIIQWRHVRGGRGSRVWTLCKIPPTGAEWKQRKKKKPMKTTTSDLGHDVGQIVCDLFCRHL